MQETTCSPDDVILSESVEDDDQTWGKKAFYYWLGEIHALHYYYRKVKVQESYIDIVGSQGSQLYRKPEREKTVAAVHVYISLSSPI